VRYVRAMPSAIKQDPLTNNLEIQYALPNGQVLTETFDMVVLSVGMQPPGSMARLAAELNVGLTPQGFCQTTNLSPMDTTRQGVYVCGPLAEPKDIPETVMSASAAAAKAMTLLADARYSLVQPKEYPPEIDVSDQPPRVGVFVCHCGTNIAGVVDVEAVAEYARTLPDVIMTDHTMFTCSTDSQTQIREAIKEHGLNRVVVASCTPRTHEALFQNTIREAGLNFYLFELANIRDQCSWVHRDHPDAATEKAKDLVRMAVAKVRLVEPLQRKSLDFNHDALVIGGGVAGMKAALELADQGFQVSLVEREGDLGGNMRHLRFLLSHADPQGLLRDLVSRILDHPGIHVFLNAEVVEFEGSLGNFKTTLGIADSDDPLTIGHGVAVLATGAQPYQPTEYLYGQDERILTQIEFEQLLADQPGEVEGMESVVMIQCVGSRNEDRPYCSRLCCSQAVKNALEVKRVSPETDVYVLYRDIRTYGLLEPYYREARDAGVMFLRFEDDATPEVTANGTLQVVIHDAMLDADVALRADRVVLSVATVPRSDSDQVAQLLKVPRTADGFFQEAHLKLRPVDFANEGIFLCGMAHYPKKALTESVVQAAAAAGRAATILAQQTLSIGPMISHVVEEKCDGCAYCVEPCPFNAITLVEYENETGEIEKRVVVEEMLCKGCGTCQATCPKGGIFVSHFKLDYLRAMTMAALEG
jgi:heterodisulfide reductase subunit A